MGKCVRCTTLPLFFYLFIVVVAYLTANMLHGGKQLSYIQTYKLMGDCTLPPLRLIRKVNKHFENSQSIAATAACPTYFQPSIRWYLYLKCSIHWNPCACCLFLYNKKYIFDYTYVMWHAFSCLMLHIPFLGKFLILAHLFCF